MSTLEKMMNTRIQKSIFIIGLLLCTFVVITLFPNSVRADHFDAANPNPCSEAELDIEDRSVVIAPGALGNSAGKVPVYDEDVIKNLISLITAMQRSLEFTEFQDLDVQRTRAFLRLLCEKEYDLDHTLQRAWVRVIDKFVLDTIEWVQTVYNDNPIFVMNQSVYYKLVDKDVFNTFLYEIAFSNIGEDAKRDILIALIEDKIRNRFPYGVGVGLIAGSELAPDGLVEELREFFTEERFNKLRLQDFNKPELARIAQGELSRRTLEIRENEANKLNWGRGFFSYEICDFSGFGYILNTGGATTLTTIPGDRRNCRVVTPGSLIQDQVSFVLGSALRQMELADETGEWVSANAALALRNILGDYGLNLEQGTITGLPRSFDPFVYDIENPQALGPFVEEGVVDIEQFIQDGQNQVKLLFDKNVRPSIEDKFDRRVQRDGALDYIYPLDFQTSQQLFGVGGVVEPIPDIGIF